MDISTNNMMLALNKAKVYEKGEKWIEQDIIVPDNMPDAIKIISVSAIPYINDVEINNSRAKIVGKINYNVMYMANDNDMNIRGLNISYPYTTTLESQNLKNKEDIILDAKLKNMIYSLPNERKIAIKNEISFCMDIVEKVNVQVLKDFEKCDDIEYDKCKNTFNNIKEKKRTLISSSEDVMLKKDDPAIYEILKISPKIKDTEYKVSYNKIMLKGIIEVLLLYLGENKNICSQSIEIPYSCVVELENISDKSEFDIKYNLRDLNLKINPDIDQKTLNVDYKIENNITVFEKEEVEYIKDFYSKTRDLKYEVNDINISAGEHETQKEITITDSISDILPQDTRIVDYSLDTSSIVAALEGDEVKISGIAKLNIIFEYKETSDLESKTIDIMVDKNIPIDDAFKGLDITIDIKDTRLNVIQNLNNIDIKVVITVDIHAQETININSIGKIEDSPIDLKDISSINIYIVKEGDSVWKIAKKYKTSMDNIIKMNNLENPNSINVGQKILVIR